jgi:spermidine synthase
MPSVVAGFVVFFTSAAVLVLEILAGRLLAPYVGVTLETYTGIIGTVLAGISLGSWYGGRLADRVDPRRTLGPIVTAGGILALAAPTLVTLFGGALRGGGPPSIVALALVGFFAPAAVLSAVTPTVVKLQLSQLDEAGTVVGRLSALGTAGAILGTFVTGFLLIAALPTAPIILGLGGALVLVGALLWRSLPSRREGSPAAMIAVALLAAGMTAGVQGPCDYESAYFCARIVPDPARDGGRTLWLDTLRHSYVDLDDPTYLEFSYAQALSDALATVAPPGEPLDVLHIGGGGFTLPRYLEATRPGSRSLVLELDPTLVEIAERRLGLVRGPDLRVDVGDARLGILEQPGDAYDVAIGDAFGGLSVPWHLTTVEFLAQVDRTLRPDGVYLLNLIDYPPLAFARAEAATLRNVWEHVALIVPPERVRGVQGGNFVFVASHRPPDLGLMRARNDARGDDDIVVAGPQLEEFIGQARVLRDDFAPVDQLLTHVG